MQIVLFEDQSFQDLLPLVYFRPVWDLRCGAVTIAEKTATMLQKKPLKACRDYLTDSAVEPADRVDFEESADMLWINGRWLIDSDQTGLLKDLQTGVALYNERTLLAVKMSPQEMQAYMKAGTIDSAKIGKNLPKQAVQARIINYLWDAVNLNGSEIRSDWHLFDPGSKAQLSKLTGVHLINPDQISIADNAVVKPGVVLDASEGPIWIAEGAVVMPNAVLEGPVYVGENSRIKIGAKIYGNTTIGPVCKIGGEVEGCIIWGYSNKQHDGFLGHAYLGAWVNIGADTNNSDLKNNYGEVTVLLNGRPVNSASQFVGLLMGDHSKTAINVMFNTGSVVGVSCNVFGAGMPPKFLPSFSWGGAEGIAAYDFDKAMAVARKVMARRDKPFTAVEEKLFAAVSQAAKMMEERP